MACNIAEHIHPRRMSRQKKTFSLRGLMIPDFLCLDGQPMHHYTVIENSKLFQHLLSQPGKVINLAMRCHNFHLRHLLWNKCVIQAANRVMRGKSCCTRMRTTSTQASQTAFPVCGSTCSVFEVCHNNRTKWS